MNAGAVTVVERAGKMGRRTSSPRAKVAMLLAVVAVCGLPACQRPLMCDAPDVASLRRLPVGLSATGLYDDIANDKLGPGVMVYRPEFPLWTDGAEKRRYVLLPPGAKIDTSDLDDWRFPVGTRLWKEFSRNGVRLETRMLMRWGRGDDDWIGASYVWEDGGRDATLSPLGRASVRGTDHDVPPARDCMACHGGRKSRVLGLSTIQLAARDAVVPGELTAAMLNVRGLVTRPLPASLRIPGAARDRDALGYLHGNCSHCHNGARPSHRGGRCYDPRRSFDLRLLVHQLSRVEDCPARSTGAPEAFLPGAPDESRMIELMSNRGDAQMPPLGTKHVDERAVAAVRRWIASM